MKTMLHLQPGLTDLTAFNMLSIVLKTISDGPLKTEFTTDVEYNLIEVWSAEKDQLFTMRANASNANWDVSIREDILLALPDPSDF